MRCGYPLPENTDALCASCSVRLPPFSARSVLHYNDASKEMILRFKHCDHLDLAIPLARLMYHSYKEFLKKADFIIPVPLHPLRLWYRRYNQATILARAVVHLFPKNERAPRILTHILKRIKATPPQGYKSTKARKKNVQGAFFIKKKHELCGCSVVLMDDVFTSGATVTACTRILKKAGVKNVYVLTLARVVKGRDVSK